MEPRNIDDSHIRWEKQTDIAQRAWKQYEEVIVPSIVHNALAKGSSFKLLYQNLAIARARCEFEKNPERDRFAIIHKDKFGAMGCSGVPRVNSIEKWGSLATQLVKERTHKRYGQISLSYYSGDRIEHPMTSDLDIELFLIKIHPFHQQLITTKNFFQFVKLSARMMFDLSHIPPTIRGSAAVNSQYFDKIAKRNLNMNCNLRPRLYDWVAYFETPEQYIAYYVVLSSIQYLRTIPSFEKYKKFFEDVETTMLKNPIFIENIKKRSEIWETIQKYITIELINSSKLNSEQIENLQSLASGKLIFRLPSDAIIKFVNIIKEKDPFVPTRDIIYKCKLKRNELKKIIKSAGCNHKDLERIFYLNTCIFKEYLKCYGDPVAEEAMNKDWCDLEIIRTLNSEQFSFYVISLKEILFPQKVHNIKTAGLIQSGYNVISLSCDPATLAPQALLKLVKYKPSYVKYLKNIYFVETDGKSRLIEFRDYHVLPFFCVSPERIANTLLPLFPAIQDMPHTLEGELSKIIFYDCTSIRFSQMIDTLRECSFASWDSIAKLSIETLTILGTDHSQDDPKCQLKERLLEAIWSGGIVLQDLIGLTLDQIYRIADPTAIALYKTNTFIRAKDILPATDLQSSELEKLTSDIPLPAPQFEEGKYIIDSPQSEKKMEVIPSKLTLYQKTLKFFSDLHTQEKKKQDNKPTLHLRRFGKVGTSTE